MERVDLATPKPNAVRPNPMPSARTGSELLSYAHLAGHISPAGVVAAKSGAIRRCPATVKPRRGTSQVDCPTPSKCQPSEEGRFVRQPPPGLLPPPMRRFFIFRQTTEPPPVSRGPGRTGPLTKSQLRPACALSWSGGKDSALALWTLRRQRLEPEALITTVTEGYERISMHGVRRELLRGQAEALGIPLVEIVIPPACVNEVYEARMAEAFAAVPLAGVEAVAFGDLFLEDVRAYREGRLAAAGKRALFPLWGRETAKLARTFVSAGFEAILVCVDPLALDACFAGRRYDQRLLAELPLAVDPCGENGEFHTFVHAGPIFAQPIACAVGEVVERDGFVFCDLLPEVNDADLLASA